MRGKVATKQQKIDKMVGCLDSNNKKDQV